MDERAKFIFTALSEANVSITDFSKLASVSRGSLHKWKKGSPIADKLRLRLAYSTALRLSKAKENGRLPLKNKLSSSARIEVLRKIISETVVK